MITNLRFDMIKNRLPKLFFFALIHIVIFSGCGGVFYKVKVNGYSNANETLSPNKIFLVGNSLSGNTILRDEVQDKIQNALIKKGFIPVQNLEEADHVLYFTFGIDTGQTQSYSQTRSYTTQGTRLNIFSGQLEPTSETHVRSYPVTTTIFTRTLIFNLYDGEFTRELINKINRGEISEKVASGQMRPIWIGEIYSSGSSSDLRKVIDYLIYGGLDHFGENTGKQISHTYLINDERVKNLIGK